MLKNQKGITLVALVVTIIVLIILAGVALTLVLGQNGIVSKANAGKTNWANASAEENQSLINAESYINSLNY